MSMANILDRIFLNEGMTEDELAYYRLPISEKRKLLPNPLMPASEAFILENNEQAITITRERGEQMCRAGVEVGLIKEPLPMPQDVEPLPSGLGKKDDYGKKAVNQNFISPSLRRMNGTYKVALSDDRVVLMTNKDTRTKHRFNDHLNIEDTPELHSLIMSGKTAIVDIFMFSVTWIAEEDHLLVERHLKAVEDYRRLYNQWWHLYISLTNHKDPAYQAQIKAAAQKADDEKRRLANLPKNLEKLPFDWVADIKQVLSGLSEHSDGTGTRKNTVVHVRLLEDYENGRLKRKKNDYLCSPKKTANWTDSDWDGHEVTCKSCIKKVETLTTNKAT